MPRAKRSPEATDAMRRSLIEAARETVAEHGLSGVTARGLAQSLGWAVGTIYTVAPSLDAILLEVNAIELDALRDALTATKHEAAARGDDPQSTVRAFADVYIRFTQERPKSWAAIFERDADSDAEGATPDWYRERQAALFALLEAELAPLTADASEAGRAARTLWAALQGILALSVGGHIDRVSESGAEELARYLVDTFLDGLAGRGARRSKAAADGSEPR